MKSERIESAREEKKIAVNDVLFSFVFEKKYKVSFFVYNRKLKMKKLLISNKLLEIKLKYANKEYIVCCSLLNYYRHNNYNQYTIFLNKILSLLVKHKVDEVVSYHNIFKRKIKHYRDMFFNNTMLDCSTFFNKHF